MPIVHRTATAALSPAASSAIQNAALQAETMPRKGDTPYTLRLLLCLFACLCLTPALGGCGSRNTATVVQDGPPPTRQEAAIVRTARTVIGADYNYGGCNPAEGFDCSGLVWWAYQENGLSVPRTTSAQSTGGRPADCTYPRQGDVIVFRISHKGLHSGIYSGNGHFVHSPKSGHVVREESLRKDYWQSRLLTCRRYLP
ncbi:MAG: C40 family peptidase [Halodesulfovibrio sp.]